MKKTSKKYKFAVIATDVVIFALHGKELKVLLIKMKKSPFTGRWAAPGGLIQPKETTDQAARRHLESKTGVKNVYLEQLYTFSRLDRDPFGRVVSVAYFALLPNMEGNLKTTKDYFDVGWFSIKKFPQLAYDHKEIIQVALERLRAKLEYTNVVYSLLPKKFTLGRLQEVYEIILGRKMDKRNFRKKFLALGLIRKTKEVSVGLQRRPARLYEFVSNKPVNLKRFF